MLFISLLCSDFCATHPVINRFSQRKINVRIIQRVIEIISHLNKEYAPLNRVYAYKVTVITEIIRLLSQRLMKIKSVK